jgi:predicted acyltransferase
MNNTKAATHRILALDVLRGLTIAGMIMVNNSGSGGVCFAPLEHAEWIGLTPTDLVFPFFMFIMGLSSYISLRKYDFKPSSAAIIKILRRTVVIFLIGLLIGWFAHFCNYWSNPTAGIGFGSQLLEAINNLDNMRILGVMQRLALCYGITALMAVTINHKYFPLIIVVLLGVYLVLLLVGNGFVYREDSIVAIVDRTILTPNHMYANHVIDPEGLLSTIPSVAHVMIGFMVGRMMFKPEKEGTTHEEHLENVITKLFLIGTPLILAGWLLSYGCPISKKIWTPSFVLITTGMASCLLALLIFIIDVKGHKSWSRFFEAFGVNPLFMYVMADVIAIVFGAIHFTAGGELQNVTSFFCSQIYIPLFGLKFGSLVYALLFVLLNWIIGYQLYKRKIYIKI